MNDGYTNTQVKSYNLRFRLDGNCQKRRYYYIGRIFPIDVRLFLTLFENVLSFHFLSTLIIISSTIKTDIYMFLYISQS